MIDNKTTPLTARQKQIYEFLKDKILNRGYGPTVREIGAHFQIQSPNGVMCHLKALERKGLITREQHKSRAIQLTEKRSAVPQLRVLGTIAAGQPVLASEALEPVEFAGVFASGNAAFRVSDESLSDESIARGDFIVRDHSGRDIAVIRQI